MNSWGFEMETLILGWYILSETNSVILLTIFGALRFIGTLISPWFGLAGDRWGRRKLMYFMRSFMMLLSVIIMVLGLLDILNPYHVFVISFFAGLVQPSDIVMRNALIGDSIPATMIMNATSVAKTAQDAARLFGALMGAGMFSAFGLGFAYISVVIVYFLSVILTMGVSRVHPRIDRADNSDKIPERISQLREFKEGLIYIRNSPSVMAILCLAFLANLTAFPVSHGLMPFVAKDILLIDENGLGHLLAAFAIGSLLGSFILAWIGNQKYSNKLMLINLVAWYVMLVIFAQAESKEMALVILVLIGITHSLAIVSMAVALLGVTDQMVRGRVIGVRMLAVYGIPLGLLASGFLIEALGFTAFVGIYATIGIAFTIMIGFKWRSVIWR